MNVMDFRNIKRNVTKHPLKKGRVRRGKRAESKPNLNLGGRERWRDASWRSYGIPGWSDRWRVLTTGVIMSRFR
jgi:hypothetical protein